jgi:hypothetical protein
MNENSINIYGSVATKKRSCSCPDYVSGWSFSDNLSLYNVLKGDPRFDANTQI